MSTATKPALENVPRLQVNGSPAIAPQTSSTTQTQAGSANIAAPAKKNSVFAHVALPEDHLTILGERYFTLSQIAKHVGMASHNLNRNCNDGRIRFIIKPLTRNGQAGTGTKLVHEDEVRRLLTEGF